MIKLQQLHQEMIDQMNVDPFDNLFHEMLKNEKQYTFWKDLLKRDVSDKRKHDFDILFENTRRALIGSPFEFTLPTIGMFIFPLLCRFMKYSFSFELITVISADRVELEKAVLIPEMTFDAESNVSVKFIIDKIILRVCIQQIKLPVIYRESVLRGLIEEHQWDLLEEYIDNLARIVANEFDSTIINELLAASQLTPDHSQSFKKSDLKDGVPELILELQRMSVYMHRDNLIGPGNTIVCSSSMMDILGCSYSVDPDSTYQIGTYGAPGPENLAGGDPLYTVIGTHAIPKNKMLMVYNCKEGPRGFAIYFLRTPILPLTMPTNNALEEPYIFMRYGDMNICRPASIGEITLV